MANDTKEFEVKKFEYFASKIVKDLPKEKVELDHSIVTTDENNNAVVIDMKEHFSKYKAEMFEPQTYKELGLDPERVFVRDYSLTTQMAREDAVVGDSDTID